MAALFDRSSILEELDLDASSAPVNVYASFVRKIVGQAVLPRKISIQGEDTTIEILVKQGKIACYQERGQGECVWVKYPLSVSVQETLDAFELQAGEALKRGQISVSVLTAKELQDLNAHLIETTVEKPESTEVVYIDNWKKDKVAKVDLTGSPVIESFVSGIKDKVQFLCHVDGATGNMKEYGSSDVLDDGLAKSLWPELSKWNKATSGVLSDGPQMIMTRSHSGSGFVQFFATDGSQYLIAEVNANKFGVIIGLWNTATLTN